MKLTLTDIGEREKHFFMAGAANSHGTRKIKANTFFEIKK